MPFTAVIVDATRKPHREIQRDARDPQEQPEEFERIADNYSRDGRLIRIYCVGQHVTPWRKNDNPEYESQNGSPTADYRSL